MLPPRTGRVSLPDAECKGCSLRICRKIEEIQRILAENYNGRLTNVLSPVPRTERAACLSRTPADSRPGVRRTKAPHRDSVPRGLCLPGLGPRAPRGRGQAAAG